ncbi:MAG: phosphatase PAP2 family protein [Myxococcales bacterium]|nr:phosphatase PAP2 family protein [Myxococcales bacterium]
MEFFAEWRSPALTALMRALSVLGSELFFLVALPPIYWLWRRTAGARLGLVFLVTVVLNAVLKESFAVSRPPTPHLAVAEGFSFPSGHAQISAAFWGWLAVELRRPWFAVAAAALVAGVMVSRVYLGVHWPRDVVAGAGLGLVAVGAALWLYESGLGPGLARRAPVAAWLLALPVLALALWVDDLERTALKSGAVLVGLWASALWVEARGLPTLRRSARAWVVGLVVGFAGVAFFYVGLKALLGAVGATGSGAGFVRYLLLGVWVGGGAPWVFVRLGLGAPRAA